MNWIITSIWVKSNAGNQTPLEYITENELGLEYDVSFGGRPQAYIFQLMGDEGKRTVAALYDYSIIKIEYKE